MKKTRRKNRKSKSKTKKIMPPKSMKTVPSLRLNVTEIKELKKTSRSYLPTFYKDITLLKSFSPEKSIIGNNKLVCKDHEIYSSKDKKCYSWETKKAKEISIKNINSKKKFNIKDIVGPKQVMGNCWLNCFFVIYFISDYGRKFFRHLRISMITGKKIDGTPIKKNLQKMLFIFNKYIESIIRGQHSNVNKNYALSLDTNELIMKIYNEILNIDPFLIPNVNEAGNPMNFYNGLIKYVNLDSNVRIIDIKSKLMYELLMGKIKISGTGKFIKKILNSHIIIIRIKEGEDDVNLTNKYFEKNKKLTSFTINDKKFVLDSAIVRDNDGEHFSAYLTVNKKECLFEGYSNTRIKHFNWKKKINSKESWKTFNSNIYQENYNSFMKGLQYLFYYRV